MYSLLGCSVWLRCGGNTRVFRKHNDEGRHSFQSSQGGACNPARDKLPLKAYRLFLFIGGEMKQGCKMMSVRTLSHVCPLDQPLYVSVPSARYNKESSGTEQPFKPSSDFSFQVFDLEACLLFRQLPLFWLWGGGVTRLTFIAEVRRGK